MTTPSPAPVHATAPTPAPRGWLDEALRRIEADVNRSADTHLLRLPIPGAPGVTLYLKDESTHPTGSLKHRLARSLFLYALCNGWVREGTTVIEASSGSTAVSEAYFAQLLDLPFVAVVPRGTSPAKIAQIEFYGGRCHMVERASEVCAEARRLAHDCGGHFMDQFTHAERATDWRGNNNIAQSIFEQLAQEPHPVPDWIVCGAGTGGTSATMGRYVRYRRLPTRICVADPEHSAFFPGFRDANPNATAPRGSGIEGIGRPTVEPSFQPGVIDRMIKVPDAASVAAIWVLRERMGRSCGGSTGTNLVGCLQLIAGMTRDGRRGSVATLLCDPGERYAGTYFDRAWVDAAGLDIDPWIARIDGFFRTGSWSDEGLETADHPGLQHPGTLGATP
ncbi:PLP-dependent cysteine synthase family protein [Azospirillum doebereinerae]|uniref:L-cysteine desulfhydrase Cds1 n=1 Tax=Azospirillum doebereinerae TaxID=92933 RepID=A0A3S0V741_9PROT|nr:PLP-dependent cysteine synthase family protein [Azospirillum doebereinerae]RUQ72820.1 PLP-dependent cysteine synthase family protein [Azospirillum doebereinerae]